MPACRRRARHARLLDQCALGFTTYQRELNVWGLQFDFGRSARSRRPWSTKGMRLAFDRIQRGVVGPTRLGATSREATATVRVAFFGNFGTRNLGNELTLQAIVESAREYVPDVVVNCVCTNAIETTAAHGISAVRISYRYGRQVESGHAQRRDDPLRRLFRRVLVRVPLELLEWARAFSALKATRMLVMTGTGMLSDFGIGPFDLHYEILKWSIVAKLRGCKLLFVSVGVGPIADPLSRAIVKAALALADYRSYRDRFSQRYLESIGFDASKDPVYPDLVFGLASTRRAGPVQRRPNGTVIGLGLMDYYGQHATPLEGERIYQRYVERIARLASWFLANGYVVRLLIGDVTYDRRVKHDVLGVLETSAALFDRERLVDEEVSSPQQLDDQIQASDFVVATRFHNVLLALLRNRPVIALSYHEKVRALMAEAGLEHFCEDTEDLDVDRLIAKFKTLEHNAGALRSSMSTMTKRYREALDEQYSRIFGDLARRAA